MPLLVGVWIFRSSFHMQGILTNQFYTLLGVLLQIIPGYNYVALIRVLVSCIVILLVTRDASSDTQVSLTSLNVGWDSSDILIPTHLTTATDP